MHRKGFAPLTVATVVVGVAIVAAIIYFAKHGSTANWETYRNPGWGFEMKYPRQEITGLAPEGVISSPFNSESGTDYVISFRNISWQQEDDRGRPPYIMFRFVPGLKAPVDAQTFLQYTYGFSLTDREEKIGDSKFLVGEMMSGMEAGQLVYVLPSASGGLVMEYSSAPSGADMEKILSTFKFIPADETIEWKAYHDERFGFAFEYPSSYYFQPISEESSNGHDWVQALTLFASQERAMECQQGCMQANQEVSISVSERSDYTIETFKKVYGITGDVETSLDGQVAYEQTRHEYGGYDLVAVYKGRVYSFYFTIGYLTHLSPVQQRILSTFHFDPDRF